MCRKCSAVGREKAGAWQEICLWNEGAEGESRAERGLQEPGERSCILGVSHSPGGGSRMVAVFTGVPGGHCSPALEAVGAVPSATHFQHCLLQRTRSPGDNELSLAFSQGREAEPLSRVGTSFTPRALRLGGTTLQHLSQDQSFLLKFQG